MVNSLERNGINYTAAATFKAAVAKSQPMEGRSDAVCREAHKA
jgi:hypothetical protein